MEDDCELSDGLKDIYMGPTLIVYGVEVKILSRVTCNPPYKSMD